MLCLHFVPSLQSAFCIDRPMYSVNASPTNVALWLRVQWLTSRKVKKQKNGQVFFQSHRVLTTGDWCRAGVMAGPLHFRRHRVLYFLLIISSVVLHKENYSSFKRATSHTDISNGQSRRVDLLDFLRGREGIQVKLTKRFWRTNRAFCKTSKRSSTCLAIPGHVPPLDFSVFHDIPKNPGPTFPQDCILAVNDALQWSHTPGSSCYIYDLQAMLLCTRWFGIWGTCNILRKERPRAGRLVRFRKFNRHKLRNLITLTSSTESPTARENNTVSTLKLPALLRVLTGKN